MYQLPVNNLTRLRRARKQVKKALSDIGLEYCKEQVEDFKEFCPNDLYVKNTLCLDICSWDPSLSRTQEYRSKPFCCTECSFSSKYYSGYKNHFRNVHRQNFENRILLNCPYCTFTASKRTMETHVKIFHIPSSPRQGLGTYHGTPTGQKDRIWLDKGKQGDNVERAMYYCKKCTYRDPLYNVVRRHIYREHFQHVVSPYVAMVSESSLKNGANTVNGNNILCKRCQFSTRSYEALVQHVVEYHERIGSQVTTMIGHANIVVSRSQAYSGMSQKGSMISAGGRGLTSEQLSHMMGSHIKQGPSGLKNVTSQSSIPGHQVRVTVPGSNGLGEGPGMQTPVTTTSLSTAQTQKWKICTVCNELFPENLYSAHFEKAHKAKKVWAMAKYIMKIHNFTSKCLLCNRYLPSDTLLNHMLIHGLSCPQCHASFNNVEKMLEHVGLTHPDDFVGPPAASPLTFDLTIKQDKPKNIQLIVITFNMKEPVSAQEQSLAAHASNTVSASVKNFPSKMAERKNDLLSRSMSQATGSNNKEVGKTLCPLCFTILKGPISDALAQHLRERHQVLQTMHPVEKKMTYKCIHCLGVYTSNMVASTITLHLVQCRAVGRSQKGQGIKSALTLNSSGAGFLKRQLPVQTTPDPKRMKMNDEVAYSPTTAGKLGESVDLVLDPRSYEHKTYEDRKAFLTTYFNQRPYLSSHEEEKLSASLWLWRSDIASHFANRRRTCERECETRKVSVLLGFDMQALMKLKHDMKFVEITKPPGTSVVRSNVGFKSAPKPDQSKQLETINCTLKLSAYTQPISIDSDSEPEQEDNAAENGEMDTKQHAVRSHEKTNLLEGNSSAVIDGPSREDMNTLQEAKSNAWVTLC
ncbi:activity-dependent neuroprotector homeobox a [Hypomesus transpacificus]|uniref:activity-dependent neuroprotector homeobox a n=1 Tax=Hypomesus transpacificus TaxID=137520 RepID=UPI001F083BFF|nr:activity-dependent neuroprotector homeobox a [Hypomesus transpacificus]XP_046882622.1 activity-dependent neuroprotector homeobox a [Hypomesus transpacificus]